MASPPRRPHGDPPWSTPEPEPEPRRLVEQQPQLEVVVVVASLGEGWRTVQEEVEKEA